MSIISEPEYRYNMLIKTFASRAEPAFEAEDEQVNVWGRRWGCNNDVGQIRMVLMHRPGEELNVVRADKRLPDIGAFGDPEEGWYWRGDTIPDLAAQQAQHDALAAALREEGAEVVYVDKCAPGKMKTVYTRDSVIAVDGGAIVTRLGPPVRRGEELPVTRTLAKLGMPILRTISGTGLMEGGSFAFITPKVAVVGLSSRVDEEGARQLEEVLRSQGVELLRVHLTGYRLHIDGMFVMIDRDTAFVNPSLLPFWFLEKLKELKIRQIEVCPDDQNWVINCLAVRPGHVIVPVGISARTMEKFDKAGITTRVVPYDKVALGGGGIHCSTSPLIRDPL
ncbi:N(G),N(G)-dimethylarginine dimethylaminohydrolase [bacterium YEK0313]|nr:N(G),N(G)-dimethylarginine dimethylaminohydrolase [bacterium YEK0313]